MQALGNGGMHPSQGTVAPVLTNQRAEKIFGRIQLQRCKPKRRNLPDLAETGKR